MVLVRHEVPVRSKGPRNEEISNAGPSVAKSSTATQAPLPQQAYEHIEPRPPMASRNTPQGVLLSREMQLMLLEQQENKRLLMAEQGQDEKLIPETNVRGRALEERTAAEAPLMPSEQDNKDRLSMVNQREGERQAYNMWLGVLERANKKRLAKQMHVTYARSHENESELSESSVSNSPAITPDDRHIQLRLLEKQNKERLLKIRREEAEAFILASQK